MATKFIGNNYDRFSDVINEPLKMLMPIEGYENKPLVSLEEAVRPLISILPDIIRKVSIVKDRCQNPSDNLSCDESAAIMLYTLERSSYKDSLYFILNSTLRTENRQKLKVWNLYLKLLLTGLNKLPSMNDRTIYRLVKSNLNHLYPKEKKFIWWSFSSCAKLIEDFKQDNQLDIQTLFVIRSNNAKDISRHCYHRTDNEALILPATQFQVIAHYPPACHIQIIQIKEIKVDFSLLQPLPIDYHLLTSRGVLKETVKQTYASPSLAKIRSKSSYISQIRSCELRSKVDLSFQNLTDDDLKIVIKEAIIEKQCGELWLDNNVITSKGVLILSEILHFNNTLKGLYLSRNQVNDSGVMYLSELLAANNSTLRELGLASNNITDIGAKCLADMLKTNTTLKALGLSENSIHNQGIEFIINVLAYNNKTLQVLYLDSNTFIMNSIINCFINMLEHNHSLKKVYIKNSNKISDVCKEKLRKAVEFKPDFDIFI